MKSPEGVVELPDVRQPMEYLVAWRMALAKNLLRRREANVAQVAERVHYRHFFRALLDPCIA